MNTKTASEFVAGDVIQYNSETAWRIITIGTYGNCFQALCEYVTCDFAPNRIGTVFVHTFQARTRRPVIEAVSA